ncbi:ROK family protein [Klebsiella pneumoniae]|uniref:ROK family protein n=1 Tax=Klebsiella pneumoniae TaxID=573 RepID=UPI003A5CC3ED
MLNGKSITGHSYITGEFGHIRLPVDAPEVVGRDFPLLRCCGQLGCIEKYLSGRGFARCTNIFISNRSPSPEIVAQWQQHRSARAGVHVERYLDLLAVCLGNILTIVDPDLLVLGGGLSNLRPLAKGWRNDCRANLLPVAVVPRIERARATAMPGNARCGLPSPDPLITEVSCAVAPFISIEPFSSQ